MKVKELIEQLKSYKDDDVLLVAFWDKEFAETSFDSEAGVTISDDLWLEAVKEAERAEYWQSCGSDEICDQVRILLDEKEVAV
jgi:hypothetical protein